MRIGVFGASFNPPTKGHQDVLEQALCHVDEVLLVPSLAHAFGKDLISIHHRLEMLKLFVEDYLKAHPTKKVKIFNVEALIQARDPNQSAIYTYDVLSELDIYYRALNKDFQLYFILGPDNAAPQVWQNFYRYQDIERRWKTLIVEERRTIRSTSVRSLFLSPSLNEAQRISELKKMVNASVADYILHNGLYRDKE